MSELIDSISPVFVGSDKFILEIDEGSKPVLSYRPVTINIDYSAVGTVGVGLPIIAVVQPAFGDGTGYSKTTFSLSKPSSFTFFTSVGAGDYLVLIKEFGHNQWQGRLIVTVGGDAQGELLSGRS